MSQTITYPFDDITDFTLSIAGSMEIVSGTLRLAIVDNTGQVFTQDFSSATGFTFSDAANIEVSAGVLSQIDLAPNETFYANYTSNIDGTRGGGTLTGTATGGASVSGGKLVLTSDDVRYVDYDADLNGDSQQVGTLRCLITPNYTGSPSATKTIYTITKASSDSKNMIRLGHFGTGQISLVIKSSTGTSIMNVSLGAWSPTLGQEYEFELNWDITTGATRLFIDGTQLGSTQTATGTRDSLIALIRMGADEDGSVKSNFSLDDVQIFSTVQHTANYTPSTAPANKYAEAYADLPAFSYGGSGSIQAFTNLTVGTETGSPKYVIDGTYHNGSSVVASDKSYTQANTLSEIQTNIALFTANDSPVVTIVLPDQNTQGIADTLTLTYTGQTYTQTDPTATANSSFTTNGITSIAITDTSTGSDEVRYIQCVGGQDKYWTGAAWADSDGTFAQANTEADTETNIATLLSGTGPGVAVQPKVFLHSDDGTTTPNVDSIVYVYSFQGSLPSISPICSVFGTFRDASNTAISGVTIKAVPIRLPSNATAQDAQIAKEVTTTSDSSGQWDLDLIRSSSLDGPAQYEITFIQPTSGDASKVIRTVPDLVSKAFDELLI